jgi:hypothetical protein
LWYPAKYLNTTSESSVICTPLEDILYTVMGRDDLLSITEQYIKVTVNSNLVFTPSTPSVYDGNLLKLHVNYSKEQTDNYTWKSSLFSTLPQDCVNLKYGSEITLHPYQNQQYVVNAYTSDGILLTSGNIKINVITKPSHIIDIDILPYKWYKIILARDRNAVIKAVREDKALTQKIIKFYYTTLQTAYRMEWTDKNGIQFKVNWTTLYQITNESIEMILSFEQQWRFFQYIQYNRNRNTQSNFFYLLNIINQIYLERVKKIPLYPMEPMVG